MLWSGQLSALDVHGCFAKTLAWQLVALCIKPLRLPVVQLGKPDFDMHLHHPKIHPEAT